MPCHGAEGGGGRCLVRGVTESSDLVTVEQADFSDVRARAPSCPTSLSHIQHVRPGSCSGFTPGTQVYLSNAEAEMTDFEHPGSAPELNILSFKLLNLSNYISRRGNAQWLVDLVLQDSRQRLFSSLYKVK